MTWRRAHIFRALADDRSGVALIEFAIVAPVLILIYLAGYQISDAVSCNRKVTITARAIADLTTQRTSAEPSDLDTILAVSNQIMAPYSPTNASLTVTELGTDLNGITTVQWSHSSAGTQARTKGAVFKLPSTIAVNGGYIIMSEITYAYSPGINFGVVGPLALSDRIFMSPRKSNAVPCNAC